MLQPLSIVDIQRPRDSLNTSLIDKATLGIRHKIDMPLLALLISKASWMAGFVPQQEDFFDIRLGHHPPPSESDSAGNKVVKNAIRMLLLFGHGDPL